jgi:nicotinate phosphoribosyltransferase
MLNESILIDFYEFTMAYGYFKEGHASRLATFDLFFRAFPDEGGYAVFAGLESMIHYIENLRFSDEDIAYFKARSLFDDAFLDYLKQFRFSGEVYAMPEGSIIFPNEPIVTIKAPIIEAQLLETFLLQVFNHQSLIATKASRLQYAAGERMIIEMGARRAHGSASANLGARASFIGGIAASSNTMADRLYGVPALGTMAHSWVQSFDQEIDAFRAYATHFPHATTFLVDTYDTLKSGVPNAIKIMQELLVPQGIDRFAVRIDSGDLAYLSRHTRKLLDQAGLTTCKIVASNALDEHLIRALIDQGAPIDIFGVGERLITAKSDPVFGGVYKLSSIERDGVLEPTLKLSDNPRKMTNPGFKQVYRIYNEEGLAQADMVTLATETIDERQPLRLFDPTHTWLEKTFENYTAKPLLVPIFKGGVCLYERPSLKDIAAYKQAELKTFWEEMKRFMYPHQYHVDLSETLWRTKQTLIQSKRTLKPL